MADLTDLTTNRESSEIARTLSTIARATEETRDLLLSMREQSASVDFVDGAMDTIGTAGAISSVAESIRPGATRQGLAMVARLLSQTASLLSRLGVPGTVAAGTLAVGGLAIGSPIEGAEGRAGEAQRIRFAQREARMLLAGLGDETISPLAAAGSGVAQVLDLLHERVEILEQGLKIDERRRQKPGSERDVPSFLERNLRLTREEAERQVSDLAPLRDALRRSRELALEAFEFSTRGVPIAAARTDLISDDASIGDASAESLFTELEAAVQTHGELVTAINGGRGRAVESLCQFTTALDEAKARLAACGCPIGAGFGAPGDASGLLQGVEGEGILPGGAGNDLLGTAPGPMFSSNSMTFFAETTRQSGDEVERLTQLGERLGQQFSGALEAVILRGEGVRDTLRALERQILEMLTRQFVTGPLTGAIQQISTSAGAALGDLATSAIAGFGGFLGFQHGGAFRVAGSGGPDSQFVPLRLSPGELVQITSPQEAARAGAEERVARDLSLNINVRVSPDMAAPDGFRKTGHQIAQDLSRQLVPVMRGL